ncbi:MAG: iron-sulfur cluster assembly protein, partial [Steroidobacteraceae bacterium]
MSTEAELALRELLDTYIDPYLGMDLRTAGAVQDARLIGDRAQVALKLGFPARHYGTELAA